MNRERTERNPAGAIRTKWNVPQKYGITRIPGKWNAPTFSRIKTKRREPARLRHFFREEVERTGILRNRTNPRKVERVGAEVERNSREYTRGTQAANRRRTGERIAPVRLEDLLREFLEGFSRGKGDDMTGEEYELLQVFRQPTPDGRRETIGFARGFLMYTGPAPRSSGRKVVRIDRKAGQDPDTITDGRGKA